MTSGTTTSNRMAGRTRHRAGTRGTSRRPRLAALVAVLCAGGLGLAGCTTAADGIAGLKSSDMVQSGYAAIGSNPITFENVQKADPQSVIGRSQHPKILAAYGGVYSDPKLERMLAGIVGKLAATSDDPNRAYRITILNSPNVNAFALPGGYVYITRGLLALANDSAEIAAVIGHEMGHITANHGIERQKREEAVEIASRAASQFGNDEAGQIALAKGKLSLARFSREQELQADDIGIKHIARAGFDPMAAGRFLHAMDAYAHIRNAFQAGNPNLDFLATHPSTPQRIQLADNLAMSLGGKGETDRGRYLQGIEGMLFGDSASDGYVRDRRFYHPGLGITFEAPEGFSLDNTAEAVLANGPDDSAIRFDGVALPASTSLTDYVKSGWIGGLDESSIRATTINGLDAVSARAKGGKYDFDVTVIRLGGEVYRFLTAVEGKGPEAASRLASQVIGTFRQLSPDEKAALKPLRIRIVRAGAGDTSATMADRMVGISHKLPMFLLLNGLEDSGQVRPGESYKIVAE